MEAIQFTSIIEACNNKLWGSHFLVPNAIAAIFLNEKSQRVVCTINDTYEYQCALTPFGDGKRVITVNKNLLKKLKIDIGSSVNVSLVKDESEYGLPITEEMDALLKMDSDGNNYFQSLTDGKKRTLLYIAAQPKNSEGRIQRAIAIVEHLKTQKGKIDYKQLNLDLKKEQF